VLLGAKSRTLVESSANPDESFYKEEGTWVDFYDYDDPSGYQNTGNFCIKGLTVYNSGVGIFSPAGEQSFASLGQNAPNPVFDQTSITYSLDKAAAVELSIYNISGKKVVTLVDEKQGAGNYMVEWNGQSHGGKDLEPGIYIYTIKANGYQTSKRLVLMR
jgi:hypothetical protein